MKTENKCSCEGTVVYKSDIAAPGYGQFWECEVCKKSYTKIGGSFFPSEDHDPIELQPWMVR